MVVSNKIETLDLHDNPNFEKFIVSQFDNMTFQRPDYYRIFETVITSDTVFDSGHTQQLNGKILLITQPGPNYFEVPSIESAHLVFRNCKRILKIEENWERNDVLQGIFEEFGSAEEEIQGIIY
jgi:hypothetical protein